MEATSEQLELVRKRVPAVARRLGEHAGGGLDLDSGRDGTVTVRLELPAP